MKKVVEQKQVVVAQAKQDCEELLVQIVQDKRVADEQEKLVSHGQPSALRYFTGQKDILG